MSRPKRAPASEPRPEPERLYTLTEAAERLSVSVKTLYRMRLHRTLRTVKLRGLIRIPASELHRLASEGGAR